MIKFDEKFPTKEEKIEFLRKLVADYPLTYQRVLQGKDYVEVSKWIYDAVPKLQEKCYNTSTRLYWILNDLKDFPICKCQGCCNKIGIGKTIKITVGYGQYCSRQCSAKSDLTKQHLKETFQKKYHVDNPWMAESVKQKITETMLKRHGVKRFTQTKQYRNIIKNKLNEINEKKYLTHKKNNSFHTSKQEDQIKEWLQYAFPSIKCQYKSERYPFHCDFFIPERDLYIEYLGSWTHGGHPFDLTNEKDIETLNVLLKKSKKSNYYKAAIYTWTDLDIRKREIAKKNSLNYVELWSMQEVIEWINNNSSVKVPYESLAIYKFKPSTIGINVSKIYEQFKNTPFPFPLVSDHEIDLEVEKLASNAQYSDKLPSAIIRRYCPSIWKCRSHGTVSPVDYWEHMKTHFDDFKRLYENRMKYKGKVTLDILREGMNIAKFSIKATYLKPILAKRLIKTYLPDANEIFNPFNGFSGIMLGATIGCGKKYIGQDINEEFINEANNIIKDFNLNANVKMQDVFADKECHYDSLFCCPPYEDIEQWNFNAEGICLDKNLSCDEWIEMVLQKYKCKNYLFVVDKTKKYENNIVERLGNKSHMNENDEFVLKF